MRKTISTFYFLLSAFVSAHAADAAKPLHALMVCGGCCHDYEHRSTSSPTASARARMWSSPSSTRERPNQPRLHLRKAELVAGLRRDSPQRCFGFVDDEKFIEGIAPRTPLECPPSCSIAPSTAIAWARPTNGAKVLGISSFSHEKARDFDVKPLKAEHPVMKNFPRRVARPRRRALQEREMVAEPDSPRRSLRHRDQDQSRRHLLNTITTRAYSSPRWATRLDHERPFISTRHARPALGVRQVDDKGDAKPGYAAVKKQP